MFVDFSLSQIILRGTVSNELNPNWSLLMINSVDISCLPFKRLIMMLVREIGLSCVHSVTGDSFGTGLTFAVFQSVGADCCMIEQLNILVIINASW